MKKKVLSRPRLLYDSLGTVSNLQKYNTIYASEDNFHQPKVKGPTLANLPLVYIAKHNDAEDRKQKCCLFT